MKKLIPVFGLIVASWAGAATSATLYEELGGAPVIARIVDRLVELHLEDPRIAVFFKEANNQRINQLLREQICEITGGPCTYSGDPMTPIHEGLKIRERHFYAQVECLQQALDENHIPFTLQNRLLAKLAAMHRQIISNQQ